MKTEKWVAKKKHNEEETLWVVVYSLNAIYLNTYTHIYAAQLVSFQGRFTFYPSVIFLFFFPIYFQCSFIPIIQHTISLSAVEFLNGRFFLIFIPFSNGTIFHAMCVSGWLYRVEYFLS